MFNFFKNKPKEKDTSKFDAAIETFLSHQHPVVKEGFSNGRLKTYLNSVYGEMLTLVMLMSRISYVHDEIVELKGAIDDLKTSIESNE